MHDIFHYISHDSITVAALDLHARLHLAVVRPHEKLLGQYASDLYHGNLIFTLFVIDAKQKFSFDLWKGIITKNTHGVGKPFEIHIGASILLCKNDNYPLDEGIEWKLLKFRDIA